MRRNSGQVPQQVHGATMALPRMLAGVFSNCRRFLFWPFFAALLLVGGMSPARADATGSVSVPGAGWVPTGINVTAGDVLSITASGQWVEGGTTQGPDGQAAPWPDNFFNITDLGVCNVCAKTPEPAQAALIAYIGDAPPAPLSYTSKNVRADALKIFLVGASFQDYAPISGQLWLAKNADAYSGYTVDNSGAVTANIHVQTTNPAAIGDYFPFDEVVTTCFHTVLAAGQGEATVAALLSQECVANSSDSAEGIALFHCLNDLRSTQTCLMGNGIPLDRSGQTTAGTIITAVPATYWVNTGANVVAGDTLTITASGQWNDGNFVSGPEGVPMTWPDNFFNLYEIGVCATCARRLASGWGALVGYIGDNPPPAGSYTSKSVLFEAAKTFGIGDSFQDYAPLSGRLWLAKNADAYSGNTADNSGSVTATLKAQPGDPSQGALPFNGTARCFRNVLSAGQNDAAAAQAVLSSECVTMKIYPQRVALDQCLLRFNSAKACLLGPQSHARPLTAGTPT
jgi:hypothetical protein